VGAWLGGTLDRSGSIVAAFILAIVWTFKGRTGPGVEKPGLLDILFRFLKLVVGFMISSLVFSFLLNSTTVRATRSMLGGLRTW
jgi:putative flippase GtrA